MPLSLKCQICGLENPENAHWWENHKIKQTDYFTKYYGLKDKVNGELLPFKSVDSYFLNEFRSRDDFKIWFKEANSQDKEQYLLGYLGRRKEIKDIIYAPGQFECKTLQLPPITYLHKHFGAGFYEGICEKVGLKLRYDYKKRLEFKDENLFYTVDSRERLPYKINNSKCEKLFIGDYNVKDSNIYLERKSLCDGIGSFSKGYERFCREFERAEKRNAYIVIMIEEKFYNLENFNKLSYTKKIRAQPQFILRQIREILNKFPLTCQILCVDGRKEGQRVMDKIYQCKQDIGTLDCEYLYNLGSI